jgi:hypothetical protein
VRNFIVLDFAQHLDDGSPNPEWVAARLGRITGTGANAMLSKPKVAGEGMRANLTVQLALEQVTGQKCGKDFQTDAMEDGLHLEPEGRFAYEKKTGQIVMQAGFLSHATLMAGASVDGYIGDFDGLVSIKCPYAATHWDTLKGGTIKLAYMRQIIHEQWLTGAQWTDFVSYNPAFREASQLKIIRVPRNEQAIAEHHAAVIAFLAEVDAAVQSMRLMEEGVGSVLKEAVA